MPFGKRLINIKNKPVDKLLKSDTDPSPPWFLISYLAQFNCTYADWLAFTQGFYSGANAVVTPFSGPAYDSARSAFYVQFNIYPLMVVFCTTTDDVALASTFALSHQLKIQPRSGRHCTAGFSVQEGGMCIDTSGIKGVVVNDNDPNNLYAVVGAGTIWDQVNRELERLNFHTTGGGCPTVGVAGYTMGGGYGFTARNFGLACDNVLEIEIVLPSGQVVIANQTQNSTLLSAFKGGMGGNFGTVTQITYRIYPLTVVYGCLIQYDIKYGAQVLNTYMSNYTNTPGTDQRVGIQAVLCHAQDPTTSALTPIVSIACIFVGTATDARAVLAPLTNIPYLTFDEYPNQKYSYINYHILDPIEGIIPATIVSEYKMSRYISRVLSQEELQKMVDWYLTTPRGAGAYNICAFESYGGAISTPTLGPDSFVHRANMCDFFCDSFYQTADEKVTAKNWVYNFMIQDPNNLFSTESYQNYPTYFGNPSNGVYKNLQALKAQVDPTFMYYYPQCVFPLNPDDPAVARLPAIVYGRSKNVRNTLPVEQKESTKKRDGKEGGKKKYKWKLSCKFYSEKQ